jgi:hypothetical protein
MSVSEKVNVRALVAGFNYSKDGADTGGSMTYAADAKLLNAGLIVDVYPFTNVLRFSAGGVYNGTKISLVGQPTAGNIYTINNNDYTAAEVGNATGEIKYGKIMPYVGFGFGNTMKNSNFTFGVDMGVLIGKPTASLTVENPMNNPTLAADAASEEQKMKDEANKLTAYPVLTMSISYRF